jgi:hypothetical protein
MSWATFWAIFLKTHLVTLVSSIPGKRLFAFGETSSTNMKRICLWRPTRVTRLESNRWTKFRPLGDCLFWTVSFLKYFVGQCLYFSFQHTNNAFEVFLYTTALLCYPLKLIPWQDSNPGPLVPEANAMSTAPRRQGYFGQFLVNNKSSPDC